MFYYEYIHFLNDRFYSLKKCTKTITVSLDIYSSDGSLIFFLWLYNTTQCNYVEGKLS